MVAFVHSDWAGNRLSRKPTTGRMVFQECHLIKSWSSNQQTAALFGGEAELYATTKGAAQIYGLVSTGQDFG